ncbi:MAG: hypothetical protein A2293_14670 [Elusimicrobia bacterium RIFOXYB2_FULL_49_7]|nr:MAG: hypothetical protein A2293_14670 [Elusimicrobia bacterium RIFOXYB2_FULL_49_7]
MLRAVLLSLRPNQWIKNLFVLAPLIFSKHLFNGPLAIQAFLYALAFCLFSSAIYLINDVVDRKRDRFHPDKLLRPVAAGTLSAAFALTLAFVVGAIGLTGGILLSGSAGWLMVLYGANALLYTFLFKRMVLLDVLFIGAGFVIRVLGGAEVIAVDPSVWLVLCTFLISLFLGFCKRKQEMEGLSVHGVDHRTVLADYTVEYLDLMIGVVGACTVISYALYTMAPETIAKFQTPYLIYTVPFVLYGVFRYLYHIHVRRNRKSPSEIIFSDVSLLVNGFLFFVAVIFIIY